MPCRGNMLFANILFRLFKNIALIIFNLELLQKLLVFFQKCLIAMMLFLV